MGLMLWFCDRIKKQSKQKALGTLEGNNEYCRLNIWLSPDSWWGRRTNWGSEDIPSLANSMSRGLKTEKCMTYLVSCQCGLIGDKIRMIGRLTPDFEELMI